MKKQPLVYKTQYDDAIDIVTKNPGITALEVVRLLNAGHDVPAQSMTNMVSRMHRKGVLQAVKSTFKGKYTHKLFMYEPTRKSNGPGSVIPKMSAQLALDVVPAGASLPPITGHFTVPLENPDTSAVPRPKKAAVVMTLGHVTIPLRDGSSVNILSRDVLEIYQRLKEMFGEF
jgi:hypothetical protein